MTAPPDLVVRVRAHGGAFCVLTVPTYGRGMVRTARSHLVVVCRDGTKVGAELSDRPTLEVYGEYRG